MTHTSTMPSRHQVAAVVVGCVILLGMIFILWRGSASLTTIGLEKAQALKAVPKTTCEVPTMESGPVQGAVASEMNMGQVGWNGNSPYTYEDCAANAQEVADMLQDAAIFEYSKALTKADLGASVPTAMWFTWNRNERLCKFYLSCPSLTSCSDPNTVSGMIVPGNARNQA